MITGIDYVLYTKKEPDIFIQEIKNSFWLWDNPYFVFDTDDEVIDIYIAKNKAMFDLMDEKGFYTNRGSGEGPFLIILGDRNTEGTKMVTLVVPKEVENSKFVKRVYEWLASIL